VHLFLATQLTADSPCVNGDLASFSYRTDCDRKSGVQDSTILPRYSCQLPIVAKVTSLKNSWALQFSATAAGLWSKTFRRSVARCFPAPLVVEKLRQKQLVLLSINTGWKPICFPCLRAAQFYEVYGDHEIILGYTLKINVRLFMLNCYC